MSDAAPLILVADDDQDLLGLVVYRLEAAGYRVLQAHDGVEALRIAQEELPDVAILDVMMPRMAGPEVTRSIRADDRTKSMSVILLTSRTQEHDVAEGFNSGADDYVTKPFSPGELQARVGALLARR
jgi:DNA-binding response OmpR family regulator